MLRPTLALLALTLSAPTLADCPTGNDLAGGIVFTGAAGEREIFTDRGDGMVSSSYRTPEGYATEALILHGVYLIEFTNLVGTEGETFTRYDFPVEAGEIEPPEPGGSWEVTVSATDGKNNVFERQVYTFGEVEQHSYGDCTYDVIPFTAEYSTAPDTVETYHYLPDLGLSYLYGQADPSGESIHPYTAIEALP